VLKLNKLIFLFFLSLFLFNLGSLGGQSQSMWLAFDVYDDYDADYNLEVGVEASFQFKKYKIFENRDYYSNFTSMSFNNGSRLNVKILDSVITLKIYDINSSSKFYNFTNTKSIYYRWSLNGDDLENKVDSFSIRENYYNSIFGSLFGFQLSSFIVPSFNNESMVAGYVNYIESFLPENETLKVLGDFVEINYGVGAVKSRFKVTYNWRTGWLQKIDIYSEFSNNDYTQTELLLLNTNFNPNDLNSNSLNINIIEIIPLVIVFFFLRSRYKKRIK